MFCHPLPFAYMVDGHETVTTEYPIVCHVCNGNGGGYIRVGDDEWEFEGCPTCRGAGYLDIDQEESLT